MKLHPSVSGRLEHIPILLDHNCHCCTATTLHQIHTLPMVLTKKNLKGLTVSANVLTIRTLQILF